MNRRATQQCNMSPYVYGVYWLPPASSAFLLARKCNWLAEKMLIMCVMRHARLQKLQRFRRKMPFYSFLILWPSIKYQLSVTMKIRSFPAHFWGTNWNGCPLCRKHEKNWSKNEKIHQFLKQFLFGLKIYI